MADASPTKRAREPEPQPAQGSPVVVGALAGAALTLVVSVVVMQYLAREPGAGLAEPQGTGTRLVAYAMMLMGAIAGAALGPSLQIERRPPLWTEPPTDTWNGHYPLSWAAAGVTVLAMLGIVLPAAVQIEDFCRAILALLSPVAVGASGWLAIVLTLVGVGLSAHLVLRLLDAQIYRSRLATPVKPPTAPPVDASSPHATEPPTPSLLDTILRIGLSTVTGIGLALRLVSLTVMIVFRSNSYMYDVQDYGPLPLALTAVLIGAIVGVFVGWKLDCHFRQRAKRRVVLPSAWRGYTPLAWLAGMIAAKICVPAAVILAGIMVVPVTPRRPWDTPEGFLLLLFVFCVAAWVFIIGRAAARGVDAMIARHYAQSDRTA